MRPANAGGPIFSFSQTTTWKVATSAAGVTKKPPTTWLSNSVPWVCNLLAPRVTGSPWIFTLCELTKLAARSICSAAEKRKP